MSRACWGRLSRSCFSRSFAVAAHDLDLIRGNGRLVVELESDILDKESPDLIAESVCIKMALYCTALHVSPVPK